MNNPLRSSLALVVLTSFSGCTTLSPETIKAMEGQSASVCIKVPAWNGSPAEIHYATFGGKSTGTAGGGGEATCGTSTVKFDNQGKAVKP